MGAKRLDQYTGALNPEQVAAGMNAALRNAARLVDDAELLLANNRFASATALAILSIEESGKMGVLRMLASATSPEQVKRLWKDYRSHTKKNVMAAFFDLVQQGARRLEEFHPLFDPTADHAHVVDQVKQVALYSDCLGKAHWSEPHRVIDEPLARSTVRIARLLSKEDEVTTREIELWLTHVAPHLYGNFELAKRGLEAWYTEMQQHGLVAAGPNAMEQFVNQGLIGRGEKMPDEG
jgi:AbiV family abortive infection protein